MYHMKNSYGEWTANRKLAMRFKSKRNTANMLRMVDEGKI